MQWSEVTKPPARKTLRQFAALFLVFFVGARSAFVVFASHVGSSSLFGSGR